MPLRCDGLLCGELSDDLRPVVVDTFLLEFIAYGVHYPIGQQTKEQVRVRVIVFLMIDRPQVKVVLQLAVGTFYFPYLLDELD